jgi:hypothetical protein
VGLDRVDRVLELRGHVHPVHQHGAVEVGALVGRVTMMRVV